MTYDDQKLPEPLTGKALLDFVNSPKNKGLSKTEKASACGYYQESSGRVRLAAFLNALVAAQGITLDSVRAKSAKSGRTKTHQVSIQANGNLLVGKAYTKDIEPGTKFQITMHRNNKITLTPIAEESAA